MSKQAYAQQASLAHKHKHSIVLDDEDLAAADAGDDGRLRVKTSDFMSARLSLTQFQASSSAPQEDGEEAEEDDDDEDLDPGDWAEFSPEQLEAAGLLGWTEERWNEEDMPAAYDKAWAVLTGVEKAAAMVMGYDEQTWAEEGDGEEDEGEGEEDELALTKSAVAIQSAHRGRQARRAAAKVREQRRQESAAAAARATATAATAAAAVLEEQELEQELEQGQGQEEEEEEEGEGEKKEEEQQQQQQQEQEDPASSGMSHAMALRSSALFLRMRARSDEAEHQINENLQQAERESRLEEQEERAAQLIMTGGAISFCDAASHPMSEDAQQLDVGEGNDVPAGAHANEDGHHTKHRAKPAGRAPTRRPGGRARTAKPRDSAPPMSPPAQQEAPAQGRPEVDVFESYQIQVHFNKEESPGVDVDAEAGPQSPRVSDYAAMGSGISFQHSGPSMSPDYADMGSGVSFQQQDNVPEGESDAVAYQSYPEQENDEEFDEETELRMKRGEMLRVTAIDDEGWWTGYRHADSAQSAGDFPASFACNLLPAAEVQHMRASHAWAGDEKGDISLQKGDLVKVLAMHGEEEWCFGENEDKKTAGWMPTSFLEAEDVEESSPESSINAFASAKPTELAVLFNAAVFHAYPTEVNAASFDDSTDLRMMRGQEICVTANSDSARWEGTLFDGRGTTIPLGFPASNVCKVLAVPAAMSCVQEWRSSDIGNITHIRQRDLFTVAAVHQHDGREWCFGHVQGKSTVEGWMPHDHLVKTSVLARAMDHAPGGPIQYEIARLRKGKEELRSMAQLKQQEATPWPLVESARARDGYKFIHKFNAVVFQPYPAEESASAFDEATELRLSRGQEIFVTDCDDQTKWSGLALHRDSPADNSSPRQFPASHVCRVQGMPRAMWCARTLDTGDIPIVQGARFAVAAATTREGREWCFGHMQGSTSAEGWVPRDHLSDTTPPNAAVVRDEIARMQRMKAKMKASLAFGRARVANYHYGPSGGRCEAMRSFYSQTPAQIKQALRQSAAAAEAELQRLAAQERRLLAEQAEAAGVTNYWREDFKNTFKTTPKDYRKAARLQDEIDAVCEQQAAPRERLASLRLQLGESVTEEDDESWRQLGAPEPEEALESEEVNQAFFVIVVETCLLHSAARDSVELDAGRLMCVVDEQDGWYAGYCVAERGARGWFPACCCKMLSAKGSVQETQNAPADSPGAPAEVLYHGSVTHDYKQSAMDAGWFGLQRSKCQLLHLQTGDKVGVMTEKLSPKGVMWLGGFRVNPADRSDRSASGWFSSLHVTRNAPRQPKPEDALPSPMAREVGRMEERKRELLAQAERACAEAQSPRSKSLLQEEVDRLASELPAPDIPEEIALVCAPPPLGTFHVVAVHTYPDDTEDPDDAGEFDEETELKFTRGEMLCVTSFDDDGWCVAASHSRRAETGRGQVGSERGQRGARHCMPDSSMA